LYQKFGLQLAPLMTGGFQEKGLRAGTENSLGAFLLAEGFKYVEQSRMRLEGIFQNYRHQICDALSGICPGTIIVEHPSLQIKSTLNVLLPGLDAKTVVARLDLEGISVSTGSACHSGSMDLSPVLLAMGWPPDKVKGAVRISWGLGTTEADVDALIGHFRSILPSMVSIGESYRIQREVSL
jgi:cysteine desulfurase